MHRDTPLHRRQTPPTQITCGDWQKRLRLIMPPFCLLLSTALLLVWLNQHALMRYWQQRYHTEAPWAHWQGIPIWDFGGRLYQAMQASGQAFINQLTPMTNSSPLPDREISSAPYQSKSTTSVFPHGFLQGYTTGWYEETTPPSTLPSPITLTSEARVLFVGDSLMQGVAPFIMRDLQTQSQIKSLNLSKQSTGLRYPAFFDWPKTVKHTLQTTPDIAVIVVFLGPNDPWGLPADTQYPASPFKTPQWETRYRARIAQILQAAQQHSARVIWVGPPNMRDPALSQSMQYLRTLYQSEVNRAGEIYLDANAILQLPETGYTDTLRQDGIARKIRTADGVHFTPSGQRLLAKAIQAQWRISEVKETVEHTEYIKKPQSSTQDWIFL
nr:SGNH family hydrolase [Providencia rettgeri]